MSQTRVNDNSKISQENLSSISEISHMLTGKTLLDLEKEGVFVFPEQLNESDDLTGKQTVLRLYEGAHWTGNIMGFIGLDDQQLVIGSRFSRGGNDYFLYYLLSQVGIIPAVVDLKTGANYDEQFFDFLLFLFPYCLKTALRKGLFKRYVTKRYNDDRVKGAIDVARHIRVNTPFLGKISYNQREFSQDNSLMQLIRHTIEHIARKPFGHSILAKAKDEVAAVRAATPSYNFGERRSVILRNRREVVRHAYYREYSALQKLCLLILSHRKNQIGEGSDQVFGILFDGAWLWEEYVNLLIGKWFFHPMNKKKTETQYLFSDHIGEIYPDFVSRCSTNRTIADAKYKPIKNIGNKDYLQLLAYMFRFDAKQGFYLYPESGDSSDETLWMNSGSTFEKKVDPRNDIYVVKQGLAIPSNSSSYEEFKRQIEDSERSFVARIRTQMPT